MEFIQSCDNCRNINNIMSGTGSKPENQMVRIGGNFNVFNYGVKQYVKKCCLVRLYLGSQSNAYSQNRLFSLIKIKMPKFILTKNEKFMVYEINLKKEEIILNPDGFTENNKLEIQRFLSPIEFSEQYDFITKTKFENNIKKVVSVKSEKCINFQYIYLIQERTAVALDKPIYKIGRTSQINFERFKSYGKGYKILLHVVCDNCIDTELILINLFKSKYIHSTDYGNEYFEGDYKLMIKDILSNI